MTVVVSREIVVSLKVRADSMAAANEALEQAQREANKLRHRRYFVVRRRGSYTERAYVIHE